MKHAHGLAAGVGQTSYAAMNHAAHALGPADAKHSPFTAGRTKHFNLFVLGFSLLVPWFLFAVLCAMLSFQAHSAHPYLTRLAALCGFGLAGLVALLGRSAKNRGDESRWYNFAAIFCFLAVLSATALGEVNYWLNMHPFYALQSMNTYSGVDPAKTTGQQLLDAGVVHFADGVALELNKAMGYRNKDMYCVAPITNSNEQPSEKYDFWAIGTNCCSGAADFQCGDFDLAQARSGLRLVHEEDDLNFRRAVLQAEAAYGVTAKYPLFFRWMQDPAVVINEYRDEGYRFYLLSVFVFFALSFLGVLAATMAFM